MKSKSSKQKRISARRRDEKFISLIVIFVLIFYPLLFPFWIIRAQEESAIALSANDVLQIPTPQELKESPADIDTAKDEATPENNLMESATENDTDDQEQATQPAEAEIIKLEDLPVPIAENNAASSIDETTIIPAELTAQEELSPVENDIADEQPTDSEQTVSCCAANDGCCRKETLTNSSDAEIDNNISSDSETGENTLTDSPNTPSQSDDQSATANTHDDTTEKAVASIEKPVQANSEITTGDAAAEVIIVNEANTNIVSNNYIDSVINITGDENYDINLLDQFQGLLTSAQELNSANLTSLSIENNNDATIANDALASASSGANSLTTSKQSESSQIITGDANANSDVVNIINRNLIGDTWIFSVINVFGNWIGDLIVPGEGLLQTPNSQVADNLEVVNENNATILSNVGANADSGENSIEGAVNAAIFTGEAFSSTNTTTIANTNITQNNWLVLLINNLGSWSGKILGRADEADNNYQYNFETSSRDDLLTSMYSFLSVHNKNQATITNSVIASATTGDNSITTQAGNASIQTGNASASANVVNIANTNIVGNNWIFAIVNILGSWTGDAVFAYPDLALSISDGIEQAEAGSLLTYRVSYENIGQANSADAKVEVHLPNASIYQTSSAQEKPTLNGSTYSWSLGKIAAGEKRSFTFTVLTDINSAPNNLRVVANISTSTNELELLNNSSLDETSILAKQTAEYFDFNESESLNPDSHLKLSRPTTELPSAPTGNTVEQSIYVENSGDDFLEDIMVTEAVKNPEGEIVGKYGWIIPTLNAHEKALISYQLMISPEAAAGTYTYRARGVAVNSIGEKVLSNKATGSVVIFAVHFNNDQIKTTVLSAGPKSDAGENPNNEEVLGAATKNIDLMPPWLIVTTLSAYAVAGIIWLLLNRLELKTAALKEGSVASVIKWGAIHRIKNRKTV